MKSNIEIESKETVAPRAKLSWISIGAVITFTILAIIRIATDMHSN